MCLFPYFWLHQAQLELLHEKAGQHTVMVRRSFPAFDSIGGLRMALSIKIKVRGCPTLSFVPPSCVPRNVFPSFNDCSLLMIYTCIYLQYYIQDSLFPDVVHVRWGEAREQTKQSLTPVPHEHYICGCRAMLSLPLITTACAHPLNRSSSPSRCAICRFIYLSSQEAQTKRKGVLRKVDALNTDPGPMEVHSNSNCRRCRADWGKTGPICG